MTAAKWAIVLLFFPTLLHAQNPKSDCPLNLAKDGQMVTVSGTAQSKAHDLAFGLEGCPNDTILITYAGNRDNNVSLDHLVSDESLKEFQKYTSAVYRSAKQGACLQCKQYTDIHATITGRMEIASVPPGTTKDNLGFLRDASGKVVGKWGWGHPIPFAAYRIVIFSVTNVSAKRLPRP